MNNENKEVAIVLGGTSPHVTLVNKLKERGYYTVLVDYLTNAPAIAVADEYINESTLDKEKVLEIAKSKNASLVISTCIDHANSTCSYVAEKLGLTKPYDYQTSLNVTNKGLMKNIMKQNSIPTSSYIVVNSVDEIAWEKVSFPAVVKPVDGNSSKGVHRADTKEEVIKYVDEDIKMSRAKQAIVEGFNEGFEIQVDCIAHENGAHVLMTKQKKKIEKGTNIVLQSTGSIIPAMLTEELKKQAEDIANKIAIGFGLKNTPFFYQAIVKKDGISVLEFAPRIGGGLSTYLIKLITGVDILDAAIDSYVNKKIAFNKKENDKIYSTNLIYMNAGTFDHVEGFEQLKEDGTIKEFFVMKEKGTEIDSDMRSGNRVAAFLVEADDIETINETEKEVVNKIKIIDSTGNDAMNRSVY